MKLPAGLIEWFFVPSAGQRGVLFRWILYHTDGSTLESAQSPMVLVGGDTIRLATSELVTRIVGVVTDGKSRMTIEPKRLSEVVRP
jgi:hypothetical protein